MFAYDTHISVDHEDVSTIECLLSGHMPWQEKEKKKRFFLVMVSSTFFLVKDDLKS